MVRNTFVAQILSHEGVFLMLSVIFESFCRFKCVWEPILITKNNIKSKNKSDDSAS